MPSYKVKVHRKDDPFVRVPRETAQDENLSPKALGLLVHMLSYPDDWEYHVDHLKEQLPVGRDAIYSAMDDLQERGYLYKKQDRGDDGRMKPVEYHFFDVPVSNPEEFIDSRTGSGSTGSGKAGSGKSVNGSAVSGKSDTTKKTKDKDRSNEDRGDCENRGAHDRRANDVQSLPDDLSYLDGYGLEKLPPSERTDPAEIQHMFMRYSDYNHDPIGDRETRSRFVREVGEHFHGDVIDDVVRHVCVAGDGSRSVFSYFKSIIEGKAEDGDVMPDDDNESSVHDGPMVDEFQEEAG